MHSCVFEFKELEDVKIHLEDELLEAYDLEADDVYQVIKSFLGAEGEQIHEVKNKRTDDVFEVPPSLMSKI
ncbi:hypothetical protein [Bacillus atrophaeus]|uniref:hypothetical protein n=1 Tax=Bacillus atrophaeus TaxID=1452 RepID=UPI002E1EC9A4|nr:hypothetical protein [Bacillus atrophaeus]MED1032528.1 hypothetical protein [Bacillus atrophaeus]MED1121026.1 hypothetical protein [Bacillus atrophaeus]